jgi:hypothetical protein
MLDDTLIPPVPETVTLLVEVVENCPFVMGSVIVNCPPCVPAGTWTGALNTHDRLPRVKPLIPIPLLDGLLMSSVKVALPELTPVNPTACTCSVAVFDTEPAKPKTHTATATASAMATAISIIVATTLDIPLLWAMLVRAILTAIFLSITLSFTHAIHKALFLITLIIQ